MLYSSMFCIEPYDQPWTINKLSANLSNAVELTSSPLKIEMSVHVGKEARIQTVFKKRQNIQLLS